jgi:hypothetical protein
VAPLTSKPGGTSTPSQGGGELVYIYIYNYIYIDEFFLHSRIATLIISI